MNQINYTPSSALNCFNQQNENRWYIMAGLSIAASIIAALAYVIFRKVKENNSLKTQLSNIQLTLSSCNGQIQNLNTQLTQAQKEKSEIYSKIKELKIQYAAACFMLASNLSSDKNFVKLPSGKTMTRQELYLRTIELNPDHPHVYYNLGDTFSDDQQTIKLLNGDIMTKLDLDRKTMDLNRDSGNYVYVHKGHKGHSIKRTSKQQHIPHND